MSSGVLLQTPVIVELFINTILLITFSISLFISIKIIFSWNFNSSTQEQYRLERLEYLSSLIIKISTLVLIAMLPYFAYLLDALHTIVPGAMCGAGVIGENRYGYPLLVLKVLAILLSSFWILLNREDLKAKNYPFIKKRYYLFFLIYLIFILSYIVELNYFGDISLQRVVSCCSTIFGASGNNSLPFNLDIKSLLIIFYLLSLLNIYTIIQKDALALLFSSIIFGIVAYYALTYFFGTYIYEIPTHICPFCMLQSEYHYIGYALWGSLLAYIFYASANGGLKLFKAKGELRYYRYSLLLILFFLGTTLFYLLSYKIKNGVFL